MKSYYVYILLCSDKTFYTGITNNLERRLAEHQKGIKKDSYTHSRRPVELVFYETYQDVMLAISWEKRIKKWSHKKKQALIDGDWDRLVELSRSRQARTDR
jgi:putative endonuclease